VNGAIEDRFPLQKSKFKVSIFAEQNPLPLEYILFVIGFFLLIQGAKWLIDGATVLARHFRVSDMVIGLTIVSVGTSFPELVVNIAASFKGSPEIAIGNIFGSNVANVLLILGVMAVIVPVPVSRRTIRIDIPIVLIVTAMVWILGKWGIWTGTMNGVEEEFYFSRSNGIILLFLFVAFVFYIFKRSTRDEKTPLLSVVEESNVQKPLWKAMLWIVSGVAALYFGGDWVVDGAVAIASLAGLSEGFVGLTIIAIGTSLPELVTSVIAARRKSVDIAVGNIIGSNIFNLLWVIGISATIKPLVISMEHINFVDALVMFFSAVSIILLVQLNRQRHITRWGGLIFLLLYIAYMVYLYCRG
jgi:cation:H+ antiporter